MDRETEYRQSTERVQREYSVVGRKYSVVGRREYILRREERKEPLLCLIITPP